MIMATHHVEPDEAVELDPAVAMLLALVDEGFDRRSWHGTNLRGALRGVTPAQALWRPGRERHNISGRSSRTRPTGNIRFGAG